MHDFIGVAAEISWCTDCGCIEQKAYIARNGTSQAYLYRMPGEPATLEKPDCPAYAWRREPAGSVPATACGAI